MIALSPDPPSGNPKEAEEAFDAAPPEVVAEILDGVFYAQARRGRPHTRAVSRLLALLAPIDLGHGWVILFKPELHLGPRPDKLVPDLAGWRRERMPDAMGDENTPGAKLVEVYKLTDDGARYALVDTYEDEGAPRAEPFEAFELPLPLLWQP